MWAIETGGTILPGRYRTRDEAVEAAQEDYRLPPDGDWAVVVPDSTEEVTASAD